LRGTGNAGCRTEEKLFRSDDGNLPQGRGRIRGFPTK
jgi:hypothetical protein